MKAALFTFLPILHNVKIPKRGNTQAGYYSVNEIMSGKVTVEVSFYTFPPLLLSLV